MPNLNSETIFAIGGAIAVAATAIFGGIAEVIRAWRRGDKREEAK